MSAPEGTMFGNYRIARPIGSGGFSTVYLAHDDRLDADVAIKVLAENRALDIDARRRFVEEARKLRKVKNSHIVSVFDVGETAGRQPFMVLEYADRGDLAQRQAAFGQPVAVEDCARVVDFLHTALSALHEVALVHRDVKPQNILIATGHGTLPEPHPALGHSLLARDERLLRGDVGFVKDLALASGLTAGGGTWAYQAPEQRQRLNTVDVRADIFSASAVVAWLLTGEQPGESQQWLDLIEGHASIGPPLKAELMKAMADSPENRHASVDEWRTAILGALQGSTPPGPTPPGPTPPGPTRSETPGPTPPGPTPPGSTPPGPLRTTHFDSTQPTHVMLSSPRDRPGSVLDRPNPPRRVRRWVPAAAFALAAGLGGVLIGATLWGDQASDQPIEQQISADGIATTAVEIDGRRVTIAGPAEISVGEPVTFTSTTPDDLDGFWIYPDGSVVGAETGVVYTADSPGTFTVTLFVRVPGAEPQLVNHRAKADP